MVVLSQRFAVGAVLRLARSAYVFRRNRNMRKTILL
jgi:hypothetical protein